MSCFFVCNVEFRKLRDVICTTEAVYMPSTIIGYAFTAASGSSASEAASMVSVFD